MSEEIDTLARPTDPVGRVLYSICKALALFGGFIVCAVALMATISVIGRASISAPVPGDVEMIEIGTSTAVFAFLPYCQLMRGNVLVDFFMTWAPQRTKSFCDAIGSLIYFLVGSLLTWRLIAGGVDMYGYAEVTGVISFPRWISFPYATVCMAILLATIMYTLGNNVAEARGKRIHEN